MEARVVNVIAVTQKNGERQFYTLEGLLIGKEVKKVSVKRQKRVGGLVKTLTPKEAKQRRKRESEKELTLENRLKYEKEKNA